jgi:hypothetical protein
MNNICIDTTKAVIEIRNIIDKLYEIQENALLSQNQIVEINDIIGTLQYQFKEPIAGIRNTDIISNKGYIK